MSRLPRGVAALAALAGLFLLLPLVGLLVKAPWSGLGDALGRPAVTDALRLSLVCSVTATALAAVLGLPLAYALARASFPGRRLVRALALVPLVLPPVVGGVALLLAFGRRGLAGQWLDSALGVRLPFTTAGAVLAETFVALPFLVLTAESAFRSTDRQPEDAARTLGARPWTVLRRVTLPAVAPALGAGLALAWARALGEFGATVTFAGSYPGRTQTLPLAVYEALETDRDAAIALSLVLLAVSVATLAALRERWLRW